MKATKYIAMAAAVLSLCACEREFVKTTIADESKFVAPVLQPVSDVVVDATTRLSLSPLSGLLPLLA